MFEGRPFLGDSDDVSVGDLAQVLLHLHEIGRLQLVLHHGGPSFGSLHCMLSMYVYDVYVRF